MEPEYTEQPTEQLDQDPKETLDFLSKWLMRAQEQRKVFSDVAEEARAVYGGKPSIQLSTFTPSGERNFWHSQVQLARNKICEGDIGGTVTSKSGQYVQAAQYFQGFLSGIISKKSFSTMFLASGQDNYMYSGAYAYVKDSDTFEHLYWFDVWIDNAKAKPWSIEDGRFVFIRRPLDANEMWAKWEPYLVEAGYENAEALPKASFQIENGRSLVGGNAVSILRSSASEKKTKLIPLTAISGETVDNSTMDDGIVWEYECLIKDGMSASGWSRYYMLEDGRALLGKREDVPVYLRGIPVIYWPGDYVGGQCYQPSTFIYVIRPQTMYNWIRQKSAAILAMLENPAWKSSETNKDKLKRFRNTPGEILFCSEPDSVKAMDNPTPPAGFYAEMDSIKSDIEEETGVNQSIQGEAPDQVKSGVGIEALQRHSVIRFEDRYISRDEFLRDFFRLIVTYKYVEIEEQAAKTWLEQVSLYQQDPISNSQFAPILAAGEDGWQMFMPEELRGLTVEQVSDDMAFSFRIAPKIGREEKMNQTVLAIASASALAPDNPILQVRLAGVITGNTKEAKELEDTIKAYLVEADAAKMQQGIVDPSQEDMYQEEDSSEEQGEAQEDYEESPMSRDEAYASESITRPPR